MGRFLAGGAATLSPAKSKQTLQPMKPVNSLKSAESAPDVKQEVSWSVHAWPGETMKPGQGWLSWGLRSLALVACLVAGCASARPGVDRNLMADKDHNSRHEGVLENYTLGCPDVVEVTLGQQP